MIVKTEKLHPNTPIAEIPLQNGKVALVDPDWFNTLNSVKWYAKKSFSCWYVCRMDRTGSRPRIVRMHRIVANTPIDLVCHHVNGNPFDNRSKNLQNMSLFEHAKLYSYR